ncbi:MAG: DJ-1 family glyoxalase III [bacterium]
MKKKNQILMTLAEGFEEAEAIIPLDLLRRAHIPVVTCSISILLNVQGAHQIQIQADKLINQINIEEFNGIILPGGMPGTVNLNKSQEVHRFIMNIYQRGGLIAAICAAPTILSDLGLLKNKSATCFPDIQPRINCAQIHPKAQVVVESNIITSQGMGTAIPFGLTIVEYLEGKRVATELAQRIVYQCSSD